MGAPEMYPELYADHMTGDPAYDKAFAALADCPSFAQVERTLKVYAHELADKQRAALEADPGILEPALINMIDPHCKDCRCLCHLADPSPCDDCREEADG